MSDYADAIRDEIFADRDGHEAAVFAEEIGVPYEQVAAIDPNDGRWSDFWDRYRSYRSGADGAGERMNASRRAFQSVFG